MPLNDEEVLTSRKRILTLCAFTVLTLFLNILGRLLKSAPPWLIRAMTLVIALLITHIPNKRCRTARLNLHHCFPDKPIHWRNRILLQSTRGMVETALFLVASPFYNKDQIRRQFTISEEVLTLFEASRAEQRPAVVWVPHCRLMEAINFLPVLIERAFPEVGVIYRPLENPTIENWILRTRERFGLRMLSRREGFLDAVKILERGGAVGVLFDQNAGTIGSLTTFMDRLCSTTELPGLLAAKGRAAQYAAWVEPNGTAFGGVIRGTRLPTTRDVLTSTFNANQWLETMLRTNDGFCANWLWMHDRWRHQDEPWRRFRLHSRRNILRETSEFHNWDELPRTYRILIRMPNWLGDVLMSLPLLRALRQARPDAELTLLVNSGMKDLLLASGIADKIITLPPRGWSYMRSIRKLQPLYFDTHLILTHSYRSDLEALLIGAPQRFGRVIPGRRRFGLTHPWQQPTGLDEQTLHQTTLWAKMLESYGLQVAADFSPLELKPTDNSTATPQPVAKTRPGMTIGMICGTENTPEKRWPVDHWRQLITTLLANLPDISISLFGTPRDYPITTAVAAGFPETKVHNLAGSTSLMEFAEALTACRCVICNDTGGMHLANALGVPVIALYGPTNPVRTGPIFDAPRTIIQPDGAPPTGGVAIDRIDPQQVVKAFMDQVFSS